jgi:spermidine/putrescine transport system permease protein
LSRRTREWLLTAPSLLWLLVLFAVPTAIVFAVAFRPPDPFGGIGDGWTLSTLRQLMQPTYPAIIWRTVWLSVATTVVCLVLALPAAYWIARLRPSLRQWMLLLIILPFWTNFLIRIFAWRTLLHPEGLLRSTLVAAGVVGEETQLLYNSGAVLLVMVYTYLPFAVLPIYAAAEKFDYGLLEAAQDLGASRLRSFLQVFLPGVRVGLLTALLMVFIPALGSYAIPDLVGGPDDEMVGNKIAQRVISDRNLPHASGLSAMLALGVLVPMVAVVVLRGRSGAGAEGGRAARKGVRA